MLEIQVGDQGMAAVQRSNVGGEGFKKEMRDLEELLSKLNPMAEEFEPHGPGPVAAVGAGGGHFYPSNFGAPNGHVNGVVNGTGGRRESTFVPVCANPRLMSQTFRGEWDLLVYIVSDCDYVQVITENHKWLHDSPVDAIAQALSAGYFVIGFGLWMLWSGR